MNRRRLTAWPPPVPLVTGTVSDPSPPFPLDRPGCRLYARARHGLWNGLRALGVEAGDEALMPAYHHGSEVEVLRRAGVVCRFYEGGSGLEPEEGELQSLLTARTRLLHLTHYLGLPADADRWRTWCEARGLFLVEDAAQSWLARRGPRPVGVAGHLAVFSVYKTFGLPDGGAAVSTRPMPPPGRGSILRSARTQAPWLSRRFPLPRPARRHPGYDPMEDFELGDPSTPASRATRYLLPRVDFRGAAARRRANYERMRRDLGDLVPSAFPVPADGASPFVFPIAVDAKDRVLRSLSASGIDAMNLWSVPHPSLPDRGFPRAAMLRRRVVGLPVHQELSHDDLDWIVRCVRSSPGIEG